ncbi:MAG: hypothetical protein ACTHKM_01360, partial [Tsuneonella sp.]
CGQQQSSTPADDKRSAEGQVLGGTISDAMLPLDTVTSQPPLLPAGADEGDAESLADKSTAGPAAQATPTPEAGASGSETPKPSPKPSPTAKASGAAAE